MSLPPNIVNIRLTTNYLQTFALIVQWNIFLATIITFSLFLAACIVRHLLLKQLNRKHQLLIDETKRQDEKGKVKGEIQLTLISSQKTKSNHQQIEQFQHFDDFQQLPRNFKIIKLFYHLFNKLTTILYYLFIFFCSYLYLNIFMFGFLGRNTFCNLLTVIILFFMMTVSPLVLRKIKKIKKNPIKLNIKFLIIYFGIRFLIALLIMIATRDICVCQYNSNYGVNLLETSSISTGLSRIFTIDQVCPNQIIRHLYATLPQDSSTSVILNAHSGIDVTELRFDMKINNSTVVSKLSSSTFKLDNVQYIGQRIVHSVLIDRLQPSTTYKLEIYNNKINQLLNSTTYRTLPDQSTNSLKMVIGGDVGMTKEGMAMTNNLVQFDPDVIFLGGDLAYDNAIRTCYYSWDNFYDMFQNVNKKLNRLVPMVLIIGNHDIGFDSTANVKVSKSNQQIPFYFAYHPQHATSSNKLPQLSERLSYHYHKIGPILLIALDSGYLHSFQSQTQFIKKTVDQNPNLIKFANYHNPIYPSCLSLNQDSNDMKVIRQGLKHWIPLFDELNFTAALEHHTHFRKMTYRMTNNTISEPFGVRYIGDGSWGVSDEQCSASYTTQRIQILQDFIHYKPNHLWEVTLTKNTQNQVYNLNYTAINITGQGTLTKIDEVIIRKRNN